MPCSSTRATKQLYAAVILVAAVIEAALRFLTHLRQMCQKHRWHAEECGDNQENHAEECDDNTQVACGGVRRQPRGCDTTLRRSATTTHRWHAEECGDNQEDATTTHRRNATRNSCLSIRSRPLLTLQKRRSATNIYRKSTDTKYR